MLKFSIGIPAFKSKFLKECIDSILNQTYSCFELIIINDCSPEPIGKIIAEYSDDRISYFINDRNNGAIHVVDNWNKCLKNATGDYFVLMGDDDRLEPTYFQEFINLIAKYPGVDVYHCRSKIISEESIPYAITPINPEYEDIYDFILSCLKGHRQQYISDFVYKTSALKLKNGFYNLPLAWASDYVSAWIACDKKGIAHTNATVFNYRVNKYSITSSNDINSIILKAKATYQCEDWIRNFMNHYPTGINKILKHSLIQDELIRHNRNRKADVIKQIIRKADVFLIKNILRLKNELGFTYKDIILTFIRLTVDKLQN